MTRASAEVLLAHAIDVPTGSTWLEPGLAMRVVPHPGIGLPIGPFAVAIAPGDFGSESVRHHGSGPGWRGSGRVEGSAVIEVDTGQLGARPLGVAVSGQFDKGVALSAVSAHDGAGQPLVTRRWGSNHPNEMWIFAPDVTRLRVEGAGRIDDVRVHVGFPRPFALEEAFPLGLPIGEVAAGSVAPGYLGQDPGGTLAMDRVRFGAPRALSPHEHVLAPGDAGRPTPSPGDEEARVSVLVADWLQDELEAVLETRYSQPPGAAPVEGQVDMHLGAGTPEETAQADRMAAILAAGADPGIARWLGLGASFPPLDWEGYAIVTVAGRWFLPVETAATEVRDPDGATIRALARSQDDEPVVADLIRNIVGDDVMEVPIEPGFEAVHLWAQSIIELDAPPDRPGPPEAAPIGPGRWIDTGGTDHVRLGLSVDAAVPLAQLGVRRQRAMGASEAIADPIPGLDPERRRPLFGARGSTLSDDVPATPAEPITYRMWQADMFGRWGAEPVEVRHAAPGPLLPIPEPTVFVDPPDPPPDSEAELRATVRVELPVPERVPGQPPITGAIATLVDGPDPEPVPAAADDGTVTISWELRGPALGRAEQVDAELEVVFETSEGPSSPAKRTIPFADPRPPLAPPLEPELRFAERPDRAGVAIVAVDLPAGDAIESWDAYMTTESRLRRVLGVTAPAGERWERADWWKGQIDQLEIPSVDQDGHPTRGAFDRITPQPVPATEGKLHHRVPGDLEEVFFIRLLPRGRGGTSPPFESGPLLAFAVPRDVAPAPPLVEVHRDGDDISDPPTISITRAPGRIIPERFRVRLATDPAADPRAAPLLLEGDLDGVDPTIRELPGLRPFSRAWLFVEVRAKAEPGLIGAPGLWSPPSERVELVAVPTVAPDLIESATARDVGWGDLVDLRIPGLPSDPYPSPFLVRLYGIDGTSGRPAPVPMVGSDGMLTLELPAQVRSALAVVAETADDFLAPRHYDVVLVDPIGRSANPFPVTWTD